VISTWSERVEHRGIRITLYARAGTDVLWARLPKRHREKAGLPYRVSTDQTTKAGARRWAKEQADQWTEYDLHGWPEGTGAGAGISVEDLTLGMMFDKYRDERMPKRSEKEKVQAGTRLALFEEAWGRDLPLDDFGLLHLEDYRDRRKAGTLAPVVKGKEPKGVKDGTVHGDLRFLSSVFNWARKVRQGVWKEFRYNPVADHLKNFKAAKPRRPRASRERYERTRAAADQVDSTTTLRTVLDLARYTGHRIGAIRQLRVSHILRTPEHVEAALAKYGSEANAAAFPHGAILWVEETDKQRVAHVTPMSSTLRRILDQYLLRAGRVGDAYLFPAPRAKGKPIGYSVLRNRLLKAEEVAELPKLDGGLWHPYRRLFATDLKDAPDKDVAALGGWNSTAAMKLAYQQAEADRMAALAERLA